MLKDFMKSLPFQRIDDIQIMSFFGGLMDKRSILESIVTMVFVEMNGQLDELNQDLTLLRHFVQRYGHNDV
jgi:hypothetical protein